MNRRDVDRFLEEWRRRPGRPRNFYMIAPNQEQVPIKDIVEALRGERELHTDYSVRDLLKLGFVVHARRRFRSHERKYRRFIDAGQLVFDIG